MASWKENKVVAIAAGVIFILAIVIMVMLLRPKPFTQAVQEGIKPPMGTPFVK